MKKVQVCSFCFSPDHTSLLCWSKPNKPIAQNKPIPKTGKVSKEWVLTRMRWAVKDAGGKKAAEVKIWNCHYCNVQLVLRKTHFFYIDGSALLLTLDHVKPKGSHPELRNDLDNLVPCCFPDNYKKGSTSYEAFCSKYYPHLLNI